MIFTRLASAVVAASLLATTVAQMTTPTATIKRPWTTPTTTLPASAFTNVGCFATPTPLENHGAYEHQTLGNCQLLCIQEKKVVMALSDGTNCWCGDQIPPAVGKVDNSSCDTSCIGDSSGKCGGPNLLWVVLTGETRNRVETFVPSAMPSATGSNFTSSALPGQKGSGGDGSSSKSSTVPIAIGVVVGILALVALGVGAWFLMRRKRQRQAEEDYRRHAANASSFGANGKLHTSNSSMNDSRLDPSFVDRRQSNGSIADNEDYSRRILKVTNA